MNNIKVPSKYENHLLFWLLAVVLSIATIVGVFVLLEIQSLFDMIEENAAVRIEEHNELVEKITNQTKILIAFEEYQNVGREEEEEEEEMKEKEKEDDGGSSGGVSSSKNNNNNYNRTSFFNSTDFTNIKSLQ